MAEGKITIPPPIGLLETDSYSAKANRVTSATSVTTTFEYTSTHADGSQVIQIVQDTNGDREVVETIVPAHVGLDVAVVVVDREGAVGVLLGHEPVVGAAGVPVVVADGDAPVARAPRLALELGPP